MTESIVLSRRGILISAILGIVLLVVGALLISNASADNLSLGLIGIVIEIIGVFFSLLAWILGIFKTIMVRNWFWLIICIIWGVLGALIYGIFGPNTTEA